MCKQMKFFIKLLFQFTYATVFAILRFSSASIAGRGEYLPKNRRRNSSAPAPPIGRSKERTILHVPRFLQRMPEGWPMLRM